MSKSDVFEPTLGYGPAERIRGVIQNVLSRRAAGESISDDEIISLHPDLMPELAEELRRLRVIEAAQEKVGRKLRVRCPHCRSPVDTDVDSQLNDVLCSTCGSHFNLIDTGVTQTRTALSVRTIGHFDLLEELGVGAFGSVWKARDTELDRAVAIKIPLKGKLEPTEAEQFLREARAAAQLRHPNIVPVHEVGRDGDTIYIVSDLIRGITLADRLTQEPMTPDEAARLCVTVADALHHAHEVGVIHRDLKPGNIMLDFDGRPYIMDFGLAKREAGEVTMTIDGKVLGTPAYMSPEQARGEGHDVDRRTDVYSLGVLLFQLLTAELPFRGNTRLMLYQVLNEEPRRPRKLNDRIPVDLETITLKAMAKDPAKRYQTAREMSDDLNRYLNNEPIKARPAGRIERFYRWCRRKPAVAALSATAILLLIAVAVVATVGYIQTSHALVTVNEAMRTVQEKKMEAEQLAAKERQATSNAESARADAEQARRVAETTLIDMNASFGLMAAERNRPDESVAWFANAAALAARDPGREVANRARFYAWSREVPQPLAAFKHETEISHLSFDPSGRYLLAKDVRSTVSVWDVETEASVAIPNDGKGQILTAVWKPNDRCLVLGRASGSVEFFSFPDLKELHELRIQGPVTALSFSADGRRLAIGSRDVQIWDCENRGFATPKLLHEALVIGICISSDGTRVATASVDGKCRVFAIPSDDTEAKPLFPPLAHLRSCMPAFVDNNSAVLTVTGHHEVSIWDATSGSRLRTVPYHGEGVGLFTPAPDGRSFAVAGYTAVEMWDTRTGQSIGQPSFHTNHVYDAAFSPNGQILLTVGADRVASLRSMPSGKQMYRLEHQFEVNRAIFSPDGNYFATAQKDGLVRIWSLPNVARRHDIPVVSRNHRFLMTPDGLYCMLAGWWRDRGETTAQVYNIASGRTAGPNLDVKAFINGGALSPKSSNPVAVTLSALPEERSRANGGTIRWEDFPGLVIFWDWTNGTKLFEPVRTNSEPIDAEFSPDGKVLVVVCAKGQILLIDPTTGKTVKTLNHAGVGSGNYGFKPRDWVQFNGQGQYFLTVGLGQGICIWDTANGVLVRQMQYKGTLRAAHFSDNGGWLSTAIDRDVHIWNTTTGKSDFPPLSHPDSVFSAEFSPDGNFVLTACRDHMARLWDWRSGQLVCAALEHSDEVFHAVFSHNGKWLFTISRDSTARVWDSQTGQPVTPSLPLSGWGHQIGVTPDTSFVLTAGMSPNFQIFEVPDLEQATGSRLDLHSLRMLGEIASGRRVHGASAVKLTSDEWFDRWREFRKSHPQHHEKLELARTSQENPLTLNNASWRVVRTPDRSEDEYRRALRQAEDARGLAPDNGTYLNTLGVAQYRVGQYTESLQTLNQSEQLNSKQFGGPHPVDIAFLAMVHQKLGHADEAKKRLDQLRELLRSDRWKNNAESQTFLREAESLIDPLSHEASRLVENLVATGMLKDEVIAAISANTDDGVSQAVRERALEIARRSEENAAALHKASWPVLIQAGQPVEQYRRALRQAEAAYAVRRNRCYVVATLGVAQYRVGTYEEALKTLTRSEQHNSTAHGGPKPADFAFLAMAHCRLGHTAEARQLLDRLRQLQQDDRWKNDQEVLSLLHEAEALIEPTPAQPEPPAHSESPPGPPPPPLAENIP